MVNGTLDWVYSEELAPRAAQPAYAWSTNGEWLIYLRSDNGPVQSHPVTDFRPVPPKITYTRYPVAGSPNPGASLHAIAFNAKGQTRTVSLAEDAEYIPPLSTWMPDSSESLYITKNRDHTLLQLKAWTFTGTYLSESSAPDRAVTRHRVTRASVVAGACARARRIDGSLSQRSPPCGEIYPPAAPSPQ